MTLWFLPLVLLGAWLWANLAGWIFVHLTGELSGPFSWRLFLGPWFFYSSRGTFLRKEGQ